MTEIRRSCSYGEPKIQPSPVPKPKSTCFSVTSTTYSCPLQCQSARYPAKNSRFLAGELVDNPSKIDLDIPVHYWQTKTSLIALSRSPSRLLFLRGQEVLQTASFCFLLWGPDNVGRQRGKPRAKQQRLWGLFETLKSWKQIYDIWIIIWLTTYIQIMTVWSSDQGTTVLFGTKLTRTNPSRP